jgi:hypothetical protein
VGAVTYCDDMNEVLKTPEGKQKILVMTMADGVSDDGNGDERLVHQNPGPGLSNPF